MCGIWGVSDSGAILDRQTLVKIVKKLMLLSETRGKDASGIAVMHEGYLNVLRKAKSSHELLQDIEFLKYLEENIIKTTGSIQVIGHSRLVTNGTQYNPYNNQPVAKNGCALVHNGIVVNEEELWEKMTCRRRDYQVDSEVILESYCDNVDKKLEPRAAMEMTYGTLKGMASTLLLSQQHNCLIATTNNGSLYRIESKNKKLVIFASEALMLENLLKDIPFLKNLFSFEDIEQLSLKSSEVYTIGDEKESHACFRNPTRSH